MTFILGETFLEVTKGRRNLFGFAACRFGSGSEEMGYMEPVRDLIFLCPSMNSCSGSGGWREKECCTTAGT